MGVSEYLEDLVARIDGPRLMAIFIEFTCRLSVYSSHKVLIARPVPVRPYSSVRVSSFSLTR